MMYGRRRHPLSACRAFGLPPAPGRRRRTHPERGFSSRLANTCRRPAAEKLLTAGESPRDKHLNVAELAAYTTAAGVILNLDEVITSQ